jgi:hypothetical protein
MYAETAAKLGSSADPGKPLQRLSLAVTRVNSAVVRIGDFTDRFHGEPPKDPQGGEIAGQAPYGVDLDRLFSALDRLETRLEALEAIG